jgi:hypothetical protein
VLLRGKFIMYSKHIAISLALATTLAAAPASAKDAPPPELTKCDQSLGTIALVEGDTTGWNEWGLGSPRQLVNALAIESGCFTPHNAGGGQPASYLVTLIAGSQEDVDKSIELGKGVATEALVRSGVAGKALGGVPFAGAALGMFGGLGGKKKTYAAGLRVVSPANGLTLASGTGTVKKSSLTFGGGGWATSAASAAGYQGSKEGKMLTEAFVLAFNNLIAQRAALETVPVAAAPAAAGAAVAVDTALRSGPSSDAAELRSLRAGTELKPTGKRDGLFIEATDNYGTTGWVSVEDLR